jgi:probable HAF family extracellular repeat protein
MKRLIAGLGLAAVLLVGGAYGGAAGAQQGGPTMYQVKNLSSLGGGYAEGVSINNRDWVAGPSNLVGDETRNATLWRNNSPQSLGTLGGLNSSVLWPVKNVRGLISGIAETGETDPLGEDWSCSFFFPTITHHTCLGFVWRAGTMQALPTLGGNNGFATGSSNRGEVVGWAENTVHDPTCVGRHQVLQFRGVIWGPKPGEIRQLPPLQGDTVTAATAINDTGQVVGISGICDQAVGRFSAIHAVLWEHGSVRDIGNLGGVAWNTPMAINRYGDVVGFSNVSAADGGAFNAHGFVWLNGAPGLIDLEPLPGDAYSQALGINNERQVVGLSCSLGFASCRAFIWQDGVTTNLNTLAPGYADYLYSADDINDRGKISGLAIEQGTGANVPFVATPVTDPARAPAGTHEADEIPLPEPVRQALLRRLGLSRSDLVR